VSLRRSIWIGWDPREASAFAVARHSARRHLTQPIPIFGVVLADLQARGLSTRPIEYRLNEFGQSVMWDVISDAPQSTQHANSRFLVPYLAKSGWAVFMDGDVLVRGNLARLLDGLDPRKALYCVKHMHRPPEGMKMDGQTQLQYARKNWSSFTIWNCSHPANRALTLETANTLTGRDMHRFVWLEDDEIGELGVEWNWLVGHSPPVDDPQIIHFTHGVPDMPGYENVPFADEWRQELNRWAS
jgi:hypothetical protein